MLYVISRSLEYGRKAGIVSALGIGAGTFFHMFVAAIGLSAILLSLPVAYEVIKYAGAAYLCYLGVRMILARGNKRVTEETVDKSKAINLRSIFQQGATTNILNPKVALFFLAFLPQFVDQSKGSVALQMILLGLLFDTSGTSVNIIVATLVGRAGESLKASSAWMRLQKLLPGVILIALGLLVALR